MVFLAERSSGRPIMSPVSPANSVHLLPSTSARLSCIRLYSLCRLRLWMASGRELTLGSSQPASVWDHSRTSIRTQACTSCIFLELNASFRLYQKAESCWLVRGTTHDKGQHETDGPPWWDGKCYRDGMVQILCVSLCTAKRANSRMA